MKKMFFLLSIFMTAMAAAAGSSLVNTKAPDFSLYDQYDRGYSLQSFARHPVVLLASDRSGEAQNNQWGELIEKQYGDRIKIVGVADGRIVPAMLRGLIKYYFKMDKCAILLDWDGMFFTAYGLTEGVANVIVLSGSGLVQGLHQGGPSPEAVRKLFDNIETALAESEKGDGRS